MRLRRCGQLAAGIALLAGGVAVAMAVAVGAAEVGDVQTCVSLKQIDDSRVINDKTILLRITSELPYRRMDLSYECNGLSFTESFSSATSIGQLCKNDVLKVRGSPVISQCTIENITVIDETEAKALLASRKK